MTDKAQGHFSTPGVPEYKRILLAELRKRLRGQAIFEVAHRTGYSHEYVRVWFKSALLQEEIRQKAMALLDELKAMEEQALKELEKKCTINN